MRDVLLNLESLHILYEMLNSLVSLTFVCSLFLGSSLQDIDFQGQDLTRIPQANKTLSGEGFNDLRLIASEKEFEELQSTDQTKDSLRLFNNYTFVGESLASSTKTTNQQYIEDLPLWPGIFSIMY